MTNGPFTKLHHLCVVVHDIDAAQAFYGGLLGWEFAVATPPDAPAPYVIASLDGRDVAGLGVTAGGGQWNTYVAVDDADTAADRAVTLGATVVSAPADAGPGGRGATLRDPEGCEIRLWEARRRKGAQLANAPGAWNFSNLHTADPAAAQRFYGALFPWRFVDQGWATAISVPGYGDHLEATVDPDIRTRQAGAPEGIHGPSAATASSSPGHGGRVTATIDSPACGAARSCDDR